jgi:hypothetical protein
MAQLEAPTTGEVVLQLTPSHLENYWPWDKDACQRRWIFRSVRQLPVIQDHNGAFGDVLHKVIERYLLGSDQDTDASGKPVNLYPEGWTVAVDRFGKKGDTITPGEAGQIRKLVEAAKSEGALYRGPNREVESPFEFYAEFLPGQWVRVHGYRDLVIRPDELWDHKSGKNWKKKKSPAKVHAAVQMQSMAYSLWLESGRTLPLIRAQHLFFCKDPQDPRVAPVPVVYTPADMTTFEERLIECCRIMVGTKATLAAAEAEGWEEFDRVGFKRLPLPNETRACYAYGGCKFEGLCNGTQKTVADYMANYNLQKTQKLHPEMILTPPTAPVKVLASPTSNAGGPVSDESIFMARVAARMNLNAGGAPPGAKPAPIVSAPVPQPAPAAPPAPLTDDPTKWPSFQIGMSDAKGNPAPFVPPGSANVGPAAQPQVTSAAPMAAPPVPENVPAWTKLTCPACGGKGFKRDGSFLPCRVCDATAKSRGVLDSSNFVIEPDGAGGVVWEPKDGVKAPGGHVNLGGGPPAEVKGPPRVQAPVPSESPPVLQDPTTSSPSTGTTSSPPPTAPAGPPQGSVALQKLAQGPSSASTSAPAAPPAEAPSSAPAGGAPAPVRTVAEALADEDEEDAEGEDDGDESPKKPGRGRKPGSKNKPKPPIVVAPPAEILAQAMNHQAPTNFRLVVPAIPPEKRQGLILLVNCQVQGKWLAQAKPLDGIYDLVARQLAQSQGMPTVYHLPTGLRRDAMAANAEAVATLNDGAVIVGNADTPDLVAFVAALRPYCTSYVNGAHS